MATAGVRGAATVLGKTLKTELLPAFLKLLTTIGPWIVAIGGLVLAFEKIKEASPEEQLKKAREESERCAQAAEEAENAYQELSNTLNGLNGKEEALKDLTAGTVE